jgi:hypothetical protein
MQAYFLRTVHLDPGRYTKLVVITNDWHMDRTQALFDHVLALPKTISSNSGCGGYSEWITFCGFNHQPKLSVQYVSVASGISDSALLKVRQDKEFSSLQAFQDSTRHQFRSLLELHDWLFTQHSAYSSSRLVGRSAERTRVVDSELLKTY